MKERASADRRLPTHPLTSVLKGSHTACAIKDRLPDSQALRRLGEERNRMHACMHPFSSSTTASLGTHLFHLDFLFHLRDRKESGGVTACCPFPCPFPCPYHRNFVRVALVPFRLNHPQERSAVVDSRRNAPNAPWTIEPLLPFRVTMMSANVGGGWQQFDGRSTQRLSLFLALNLLPSFLSAFSCPSIYISLQLQPCSFPPSFNLIVN